MLLEVLADEIEQRCDICGTQRRLATSVLQAGIEVGEPPEPMGPDILALPPCTQCGAQEFLHRVSATSPGAAPGARGDAAEHRRAVNALHAMLVAQGRTVATLSDWYANENSTTERAEIPWTFSGQPMAIVGIAESSDDGFADFLASRGGGG